MCYFGSSRTPRDSASQIECIAQSPAACPSLCPGPISASQDSPLHIVRLLSNSPAGYVHRDHLFAYSVTQWSPVPNTLTVAVHLRTVNKSGLWPLAEHTKWSPRFLRGMGSFLFTSGAERDTCTINVMPHGGSPDHWSRKTAALTPESHAQRSIKKGGGT